MCEYDCDNLKFSTRDKCIPMNRFTFLSKNSKHDNCKACVYWFIYNQYISYQGFIFLLYNRNDPLV